MILQVLTVLTVLLFVVQHFNQDTQCVYERKIEARLCHHCCRGQAMSVIYSEFESVAFIIQHAMRMGRVTLSSLGSLTVLYFHIIS